MFYLQGQNANGSVIAVTSTATNLYDLINTAASTTLERAGYSFKANGINILPEDGDVRILFDSTLSPTASKGMLLTAGTQYFLRNVPLDKMKLIRTGGTNVSCSIGIGICDATETSTAVAGVGSSSLVEAVDVAKMGGIAVNMNSGNTDTGTQRVVLGSGGTSTRTTVTPSLSSQALIAANTSRKGLRIVHTATDPSQNLWIAAAATATSAIYFTKLTGSGEVSLYHATEWPYSGQYSVISDVATGTIQVYELT